MQSVSAVVMAAGEGKRMQSSMPKVLHPLCGQAMLEYVLDAVETLLTQKPVLVVGHAKEQIEARYAHRASFARQDRSRGWGTAKAVEAGIEGLLQADGYVIVTAGDMPMVRAQTYARLLDKARGGAQAVVLTALMDNPFGYGRIVREGEGIRVVEQKDLSPEFEGVREINASAFCFDIRALREALPRVGNQNASGEYYLPDVLVKIAEAGGRVDALCLEDAAECAGANDRVQLAGLEKEMRGRINRKHQLAGVTMVDPEHTYIGPKVRIGRDSTLYPGCMLEGETVIEDGVTLLQNCRIADSQVGSQSTVESSVMLHSSVGRRTHVGPFAYLRPGSRVGDECKVGDFVEIKNASIGDGTKISHLTYVGDADVGKRVNLGCGVVVVNYDGKAKNRTVVEDGAFVGCNTNLISPVTVGREAYIAAGSTIAEDVPEAALAIARCRQTNKDGWVRKRKGEGKL